MTSQPPNTLPDDPRTARVPAEHLDLARRLRTAEDRLFPIAMVDAELYERAVRLVGLLAKDLTHSCANLDQLAQVQPETNKRLLVTAHTEDIPLIGLDLDLVVEAAMSQRFRAILAEQAVELLQQHVDDARAAGLRWALLEEPDASAWSIGAVRWVEVHVATGALMVRSVAAEPRTGEPVYRIELFDGPGPEAGPPSGIRAEEFTDRNAWLTAINSVRSVFESES
jgi:hypothetical protein